METSALNATRFVVDGSFDNNLVVDILGACYDALKIWSYSKSVTENQYTCQQVVPFISPVFKGAVFKAALFDKRLKDMNVKPDCYLQT